MQEAASISPPGSMIITNFMTEEGLQLLRAPQPTPPPQPPAIDAAASSSATDAQLRPSPAAADSNEQAATSAVADSSSSCSTGINGAKATEGTSSPAVVPAAATTEREEEDSSKQAASSGSGAGRQGSAVVGAEGGAKASGGAEARRTNLTSSFKWGCPDNVEQVSSPRRHTVGVDGQQHSLDFQAIYPLLAFAHWVCLCTAPELCPAAWSVFVCVLRRSSLPSAAGSCWSATL